MKRQLYTVNQHIDQCDSSCEIAEEVLANMGGLPLSLVEIEEEEGNNNDDVGNADEDFEEGSDESDEDRSGESEEEPEMEYDKSDSNSNYPNQPKPIIKLILKGAEAVVNQIEKKRIKF